MYNDLHDALSDLSPTQIKANFSRDGEHSITLSGLCSDGMAEVLRHLVDEMELETNEVFQIVPQLKRLSVADLLASALRGDGLDVESLLENLEETESGSSVGSSDVPRVGDTYTSTRKVIAVYHDSITYEDETGKRTNVLIRSFKGWARNKKKS